MIIYVDLEHEQVAETPAWEESFANRLKIQYRLEDISGEPCLIQRYFHITPGLLRTLNPRAVIISGCATEITYYEEAKLAGLRQVLRDAAQPILGFCAGEQLLAQTYGVEIAPMGPLAAGQPDPYPEWDYGQGMRRERGFTPVRVLEPHPLREGLGPAAVLLLSARGPWLSHPPPSALTRWRREGSERRLASWGSVCRYTAWLVGPRA